MDKNKSKGLLEQIKQLFNKAEKFEDHKLADGTMISADKIEVDGMVTIGGTPAPAGEYTLEDGTTIVCDATGKITEVKPKVAAAAPPADPAAAPPDLTTPAGLRAAYDTVATGTPDEKIGKLTILCKAMMEYCFGWQLREAAAKQSTDEAIKVYKELTDATATTVATQQAAIPKIIELMSQVLELPTETAPVQKKKFSFGNTEAKNKSMTKFQEAALKLAEEWKEREGLKAV